MHGWEASGNLQLWGKAPLHRVAEERMSAKWRRKPFIRPSYWPGAVAHACYPSILGGQGGGLPEVKSLRPAGQYNETLSLLKIQKLAGHGGSVIPATQETEAGELPEPRRRRLRWAKIVPLHSSLGNNSETPSQKKKKEIFSLRRIIRFSQSYWFMKWLHVYWL